MRITFTILGFLSAIIAIVLSILPFGLIALIPIVIAFVFGLLAFKQSKKDDKSVTPIQLIFLLVIIALALTTYRSIFTENKVEADTEFIDKQESSEEKAIEELDALDINEGSGD